MLDVGAHWGTSLASFLAAGWTGHAFEPAPASRAKLVSDHPNSSIDHRAVTEKDCEMNASFYQRSVQRHKHPISIPYQPRT